MATESHTSDSHSDTSVNRGQLDPSASFSWSDPKEGHRLMRSFMSIKEATLRDAIVKFVTQLSVFEDDGR